MSLEWNRKGILLSEGDSFLGFSPPATQRSPEQRRAIKPFQPSPTSLSLSTHAVSTGCRKLSWGAKGTKAQGSLSSSTMWKVPSPPSTPNWLLSESSDATTNETRLEIAPAYIPVALLVNRVLE